MFLTLQRIQHLPVQHSPGHRQLWITEADGRCASPKMKGKGLSFQLWVREDDQRPSCSYAAVGWVFILSHQVLDSL